MTDSNPSSPRSYRQTGMLFVGGILGCFVLLAVALIAGSMALRRAMPEPLSRSERDATQKAAFIASLPHATRSPTATPGPAIPDITQWETVLEEDFPDNAQGWVMGEQSYRGGSVRATWRLDNDHYTGLVDSPSRYAAWSTRFTPQSDRFAISVDAQRLNGVHGDVFFGIAVRESGGDLYIFEVSEAQQGRAYRIGGISEDVLATQTLHSVVSRFDPNHLVLVVDGSEYTFWVNDEYVIRVVDDRLRGGAVGVALRVAQESHTALVFFDNFTVHVPGD